MVWINEGDPIPWGTSADQAKPVERISMLSERLARRGSGELKGGYTRVQMDGDTGEGHRNGG